VVLRLKLPGREGDHYI